MKIRLLFISLVFLLFFEGCKSVNLDRNKITLSNNSSSSNYKVKLNKYIQEIQEHLIVTHSQVLKWFEESEDTKHYRPKDKGWTVSEILEHIALTSHFLLILIDKGADKALRNINELSLSEVTSSFDYSLEKINEIGIHKSFDWIRPEHMEPIGKKSELEVKAELISQLTRCLNQLISLREGQGLLYSTTMTVNGLGKINVYEYIYFLSKHAERHLRQMEENKDEFASSSVDS